MMDGTLAQILQQLFESEQERARLSQENEALKRLVEGRKTAENPPSDAAHNDQKSESGA